MKLKFALTLCAAAAVIGMAVSPSHAGGLIVPAYLPLTDTADFGTLASEASTATASTNPTYKEFWVVVNGPSNGPFTNSTDWTTAAGLFNPIRSNGGKIFGYVHTNSDGANAYTFRSLSSVEADITSWKTNYTNLDGIWLDEFYPRFEIAEGDGSTADFPNGTSLAPYITSPWLGTGDAINGSYQINPNGGYYSQLVAWIRSTYPTLRIIGNAGGYLYSNQYNYLNLCDVTCTFEQDFTLAYDGPSDTYNWAGLTQMSATGCSDYQSQLAIITGNTTDLDDAIDQSIDHGYQYFYTTNVAYGGNLYGTIPSYFDSEVSYVAAHS